MKSFLYTISFVITTTTFRCMSLVYTIFRLAFSLILILLFHLLQFASSTSVCLYFILFRCNSYHKNCFKWLLFFFQLYCAALIAICTHEHMSPLATKMIPFCALEMLLLQLLFLFIFFIVCHQFNSFAISFSIRDEV